MWVAGLVTLDHLILIGTAWRPAAEMFPTRVQFNETVYNLAIESSEPFGESHGANTERSFILASGLACHNFKPSSF